MFLPRPNSSDLSILAEKKSPNKNLWDLSPHPHQSACHVCNNVADYPDLIVFKPINSFVLWLVICKACGKSLATQFQCPVLRKIRHNGNFKNKQGLLAQNGVSVWCKVPIGNEQFACIDSVLKLWLCIITCLCNIVVWLVSHRMSPGKPEDPRAPHTEAGSSPGSSDQWRKGLHAPLSSSSLIVLWPLHWEVILTQCFFFLLSEEWPSLHHPRIGWGPVLGPASMVLPGVRRTQGHETPTADLAVPDCSDTPPTFQQPRRAASGDQGDTGQLLSAPELEPPVEQRVSRQAELGGQPDFPPEPNAKYANVRGAKSIYGGNHLISPVS